MASDKEILTQVQQQVAYLNKQIVYLNNKIQTVAGNGGNNSRLTNDLIKLLIPYLPFVGYINTPILEDDGAITGITITESIYDIKNNDEMQIVNTVTGNVFDIKASANLAIGGTALSIDSFTPTEDIGINAIVMFKMEVGADRHFNIIH
jgi:hypothetical protein